MKISATFFFRTVLMLTLLLALSGCHKSTNISTNGAGHAISAVLEGAHSIDTREDRALIAGDFGKITIESARVRLGDGPWTKIPEQVPISVGIFKHKRWVTAGRVSVKETN
jgi:hypothetical protein